jgi:phosphoenolpyruvate carboxylase
MNYFDSHYISNSDLKKASRYWNPQYEEPENIEEIFKDGTLIHETLLEPHKVMHLDPFADPKFALALEMAKTMRKDPIIDRLFKMHDFRVEHEFYREDVHGVKARCKMDGSSKSASVIFEYKGLSVTTQSAFEEAITRFDYDQGAAWYLDVVRHCRYVYIGAPSKKDPRKKFSVLIDRNHKFYTLGLHKVKKSIAIIKQFDERFS